MIEKPDPILTNDETREYISYLAREHGGNEEANADKFSVVERLLLPSDEAPRVLECGGGTGLFTRHLLELGYDVTCVDLSEDALAHNRSNAVKAGYDDRLTTICGDFSQVVDGLQGDFDQVLFLKVLHHFESLESVHGALVSAVDGCRAGGRVVVFEPNGRNPLWRFVYSLRRDPVSGRKKWFYEQNMRFTTVPNLTAAPVGRTPRVGYHYVVPASIAERVGPLEALNRWLERSPLRRAALNLSLVIDI